jgi:anti-sigma regulatory factor (Ser/Thr protein kinase)
VLRRSCLLIRNTPSAPAEARRYVGDAMADSPREVVDVATLLVSELATNCVRHLDSDFTVSIEQTGGAVRVDVADDDGSPVRMRRPRPDEVSGRGLCIVEDLADEWGVIDNGDHTGKRVWFTLQLL